MELEIAGIYMVALSISVFFTGYYLVNKISILRKFSIPEGIVGGLICSIILYLLKSKFNIKVVFDTDLRDLFLLIFFCTVGMTAKLGLLVSGGRTLIKLICVIFIFLVLQNMTGILVAKAIGAPLIHGLIAGSITLAGGHGTAISWGAFFEAQGYQGTIEFGLISATVGLICGGIFGGPVAQKLIEKHSLLKQTESADNNAKDASNKSSPNIERLAATFIMVLTAILFVIICIMCGELFNEYLIALGVVTPAYLSVLIIGILFTNTSHIIKINLSPSLINLFRDVSLQVFITMSMMCINLEYLLDDRLYPILMIVVIQVIVIIIFAKKIFFKAAGKDYDGAVITAGFVGSGLGATPVALANVDAIGRKYHQSSKALLIVPLLGSVFTDLFSAIILQVFLFYIGG